LVVQTELDWVVQMVFLWDKMSEDSFLQEVWVDKWVTLWAELWERMVYL
jgi:hypothetical protein